MAELTQNYGLRKDSQEDFYNVDVFNSNFDIIDQNMKEIDTIAKNKDGGNADTLDGKHANDFLEYKIFNNLKEAFECEYPCAFKIPDDDKTGLHLLSNSYKIEKNTIYEYITLYADENDIIFVNSTLNVKTEFESDEDYAPNPQWTVHNSDSLCKSRHNHLKSDITDLDDLKIGNEGKVTVSYSEYAWDSNKLNGKNYNSFVTSGVYFTDEDLNNAGFEKAYITFTNSENVVPETNKSDSNYWHIMFFPYNNGSGTQIAMPFSQAKMYIRAAKNGKWSEWNNISDYGNANTLDGKPSEYFAAAENVENINKTALKSKLSTTVFSETSASTTIRTVSIEGVQSWNDVKNIPLNIKAHTYGDTNESTLNINNLGAKNIYFPSISSSGFTTIPISNLWVRNNGIYTVVWDGTYLKILNPQLIQASTEYKGIVQLTDSTSSTSKTMAATANSLKKAYDLADGKANKEHTHTISQITNLPESFPANGGNADTVDNKHASDFINTFNITSNVNWNTLTNTGIYNIKTTGGTNNPASHHGALYVNNTVGTPFQMFIPDGDTEYIFKRRIDNNWKKLYLGCSELGFNKILSLTPTAGNWYRIIHSKGDACGGIFIMHGGVFGKNSTTVFSAAQQYSSSSGNNKITKITHSSFNDCITKIRLVTKYGTPDQYIDVYFTQSSDTSCEINLIFIGRGWDAYDNVETANIVSESTITEISL